VINVSLRGPKQGLQSQQQPSRAICEVEERE